MNTTIALFVILGLLVGAIFVLGYCCAHLLLSRTALEKKLKECEDRLLNVELTQDQIDFKDKLEAKYDELFNQLKFNVDLAIFESKSSFKDLLDKGQQKFDQDLKAKFNEACEKIKFDEIEYKKTITKKRKEFSRKNGKDAKPQRSWRYIDEE
jgi:hypothetical protein